MLCFRCERNCRKEVNTNEDFVLVAEYKDYLPNLEASYSWIVLCDAEVVDEQYIEHNDRTLTIRAGFLQRGQRYNVSVTGKRYV